ncbi:MAG TPA: metalloregulator ArsR/SmtB family transcription factor [Acidimicrobiia bacterium]|nr:metalloregulator ArsR/SmtB family transcription factor [Acidimicrobiia bacterium]
MESGEAKQALYEQFARVGKVVAHAKRIELLDLIAQGERPVEQLALAARMSVANTSAHLQVLRRARLVETRKKGTRVFYRLAGDEVVAFINALRNVAGSRLAEVDQIARDYFDARDELEPIRRGELVERAKQGEIVVVDVRPAPEYAAGHIPAAVSIPLDALEDRIAELPADAEVVAYCRGPYCVLAVEAVALLRQRGRRARRLEDGLPEWRLAGLPVAVGQD